jgi:ethanolamine utilization protein EutN
MYLGKVIGTVVATQKYEGLEGTKLLVVTPLNHRLERSGDDQVAVDTVRAGRGDLVYLVGSREAALALDPWFVPVDAAIVGVVDDVDAAAAARGTRSPAAQGSSQRKVAP